MEFWSNMEIKGEQRRKPNPTFKIVFSLTQIPAESIILNRIHKLYVDFPNHQRSRLCRLPSERSG